ncbi:MAG: exosortase/archaeosortase family protein [Bdellovibrionaceae bacterium]|nr:exosortase/archaeosortase family protein [Pseudobdellovibrionaceae bacterium]
MPKARKYHLPRKWILTALIGIPALETLAMMTIWSRAFSLGPIIFSCSVLTAYLFAERLFPEKRGTLTLDSRVAVLNFSLFLICGLSAVGIERLVLSFGQARVLWSWSLLWTLCACSSVAIFFPIRDLVERARRNADLALPLCLLLVSTIGIRYLSTFLWNYVFLGMLSKAIHISLWIAGYDQFDMYIEASRVYVTHPLLSVNIAEPCGGFTGYMIFFVLYSLVLILDGKKTQRRFRWGTLAIGLVYMSLLNIARIGILLGVALREGRLHGAEAAGAIVKGLFHSHAGWIVYLVGLIPFFVLVYKFIARQIKEPVSHAL